MNFVRPTARSCRTWGGARHPQSKGLCPPSGRWQARAMKREAYPFRGRRTSPEEAPWLDPFHLLYDVSEVLVQRDYLAYAVVHHNGCVKYVARRNFSRIVLLE